jgi:hypothetical protein
MERQQYHAWKRATRLLRPTTACRQLYNETKLLPYKDNTFRASAIFMQFLFRTFGPPAFKASIQQLEIWWGPHTNDLTRFADVLTQLGGCTSLKNLVIVPFHGVSYCDEALRRLQVIVDEHMGKHVVVSGGRSTSVINV